MPLPAPLTPGSLDEMLGIVAGLERVHFWRGSADSRWLLDSTLVRLLKKDRWESNEHIARHREKSLLSRARHRGYDIVNGVRLSDLELLALLRHHGAACRLVDFTKSAAVGLWFSALEVPKQSGQLLGINTDYVHGYEDEPIGESYDDVMRLAEKGHPVTWTPMQVSGRVAAQHSQFLFGPVEDYDYGSLGLPVEHDAVVNVLIEPGLKPVILTFLRKVLDIGSQTMFPDLPGFAVAFSSTPPEEPYRW